MNFCYESKVDSQSKLPVRVGGQSVAVRFLARPPPPALQAYMLPRSI